MKNTIFFFLCLMALTAFGQSPEAEFNGKNWTPPYTLAIPDGWDVERFQLPPAFAPEIPYKGIEDIRFTPGWGNIKTDDYWSYAFLWYLDGLQTISEGTIQANLKSYYTGLIKVNLDPKKVGAKEIPEAKTNIDKIKTAYGDLKTYSGTVEMLDYMQQKPIVLNCLVHSRHYELKNKTIIFYELSPKPLSAAIWKSLNKLWADFLYE